MKLKHISGHFVFMRIAALCISLQLVSCAAGVDPSEDPVQPSNGENEDENVGENENESENVANENNEQGNNETNVANAEGENGNANDGAMNNSEEENFTNAQQGGQGNLFSNGTTNNNLLNNQQGAGKAPAAPYDNLQTEDTLVNNAEAEDLITTQNSPELGQGATDLGPIPTEQAVVNPPARMGNGTVRYVVAGGSSMHDGPNGAVVKSLEQGDHPLVSEEGEWARTSDGFYVPSSSLSPQPIGRAKRSQAWR